MVKHPDISELESDRYTLIKEISFTDIKPFILRIIQKRSALISFYSAYQAIALLTLIFLLANHIYKAIFLPDYHMDKLYFLMAGLLFSFTLLILLHELLHAMAYYALGKRNLLYGADIKRFIFYVHAHKQVMSLKEFTVVALAPFVLIQVVCIPLVLVFWNTALSLLFGSIVLTHALFCAGDFAMLAFCYAQKNRQLYTYDDSKNKVARFYIRNEISQ